MSENAGLLKAKDMAMEMFVKQRDEAQQQLAAANARILDYESEIAAVCPEDLW